MMMMMMVRMMVMMTVMMMMKINVSQHWSPGARQPGGNPWKGGQANGATGQNYCTTGIYCLVYYWPL